MVMYIGGEAGDVGENFPPESFEKLHVEGEKEGEAEPHQWSH